MKVATLASGSTGNSSIIEYNNTRILVDIGITTKNIEEKLQELDINPGDRAETCHGTLEPIGLEIDSKKGYVIIFKCKKCGKIRKNKAAKDDNMDLIIKLSAKHI